MPVMQQGRSRAETRHKGMGHELQPDSTPSAPLFSLRWPSAGQRLGRSSCSHELRHMQAALSCAAVATPPITAAMNSAPHTRATARCTTATQLWLWLLQLAALGWGVMRARVVQTTWAATPDSSLCLLLAALRHHVWSSATTTAASACVAVAVAACVAVAVAVWEALTLAAMASMCEMAPFSSVRDTLAIPRLCASCRARGNQFTRSLVALALACG